MMGITQIVNLESLDQLINWISGQKTKNNLVVVGTDSTGKVSLLTQPLKTPIVIILGNEAKGMSVGLQGLCDFITSIPLAGKVNSLNVSCAGSIFLWDVYRNSTSV